MNHWNIINDLLLIPGGELPAWDYCIENNIALPSDISPLFHVTLYTEHRSPSSSGYKYSRSSSSNDGSIYSGVGDDQSNADVSSTNSYWVSIKRKSWSS